jgi:hypothetical protein
MNDVSDRRTKSVENTSRKQRISCFVVAILQTPENDQLTFPVPLAPATFISLRELSDGVRKVYARTIMLNVGATRLLRWLCRFRVSCARVFCCGPPWYADGGCDIYKDAMGPAFAPPALADLLDDTLKGLWKGIALRSAEEKEVLAAPRAG